MKTLLFRRVPAALLPMIFPALCLAQNWDNPANRYLDAHQAYADAACPIPADDIRHFVYFARDRGAIRDHAFLTSDRFDGAQIMYSWGQLEGEEGVYDFSDIRRDLDYLAGFNKQLFIQLQDATFTPDHNPVPRYLRTDAFDDGATLQYTEDGKPEGWVTKRWSAPVQDRFAALLAALGAEFDGVIAGINLQESAIGISNDTDPTFTAGGYAEALKANMTALKSAFPNTPTMQYANFMPGEWLPWEDEGYLRGIYEHGASIGVGLGAPDLLLERKGQLNHALAMMHEGDFYVPIGIAIQDGNYVGQTNSNAQVAGRDNIVPKLHAFAQDFLKVDHMFWVNQDPYFEEDVLACFTAD